MRVTQSMIDRNLMFAMARNLERLSKLNEQLSTGQRVSTVSDDVPAAGQIMFLQRENQQIDAYLRNLSSAVTMHTTATSTLQAASETIIRIKELAIQAATETYTDVERQIMAQGVANLLDTLVSLANVESNSAYVFSGEATETVPYLATTDLAGDVVSVLYQGEMIGTEAAVGPRTMARMNLVGQEVFRGAGDLFQTVISLREAMHASDRDAITQSIGELEIGHTDIRRALGRLGERQAQLEVARTSLERLRGLNEQVLTDKQDTDIAQAAVQYNSMMALMQMVMKVAAGAVSPSIIDFL